MVVSDEFAPSSPYNAGIEFYDSPWIFLGHLGSCLKYTKTCIHNSGFLHLNFDSRIIAAIGFYEKPKFFNHA